MEDFSNIGNPKGMKRRQKDEYIQVAMSSRTDENTSIFDLNTPRKSKVKKSIGFQKTANDIQQENKIEEKKVSAGKVLGYNSKQPHIENEALRKAKCVVFSQSKSEAQTTRSQAMGDMEIIKLQRILIFGGIDPYCGQPTEDRGKRIFQYDIYLNHWNMLGTMPGSRHHHSAVFFQDKVFMIGGTIPSDKNFKANFSNSMWSFDIQKLEWHDETPLPFPRRDFGLVAASNGLHVIGGENSCKSLLGSHLFYNASTKHWIKKTPLNIARAGLACAIFGLQIWAAGGMENHGGTLTNTVEAYDIKENVWTLIHHLRIPRCFGKFCIVNKSNIYLVGGVTLDENKKFLSVSSIDRYFFEFREWKEVTQMSKPRHGHDVVAVADKIFIFGGVSTQSNQALESVECLWTENMTWITGITPMPIAASGLAALSLKK